MAKAKPVNKQSDEMPWNVMIYMAADNNLSEECVYALKEINRLNLSDKINVVAQLDTNVRGIRPKRHRFNGESQNGVKAPAIAKQGTQVSATKYVKHRTRPNSEVDGQLFKREDSNFSMSFSRFSASRNGHRPDFENSADPKVLENFIRSSIRGTEPGRNLVILSGHGSGAIGDFLRDSDPPSALKVPDLKDILNEVRFDLPGQDRSEEHTSEL